MGFNCPKCNKNFKSKKYLVQHLNKKFDCSKLLSCYYCNTKCTTEKLLKKHIRDKHKDIHIKKGFKCIFCSSNFRNKTDLLIHKENKCQNEKR